MPDLDTTFRCTAFACTLAYKHCLRRQTERHNFATRVAHGDRAGQRVTSDKPKHPYCASGECAQGREIAALFPDHVPARIDPRKPPRLDLVEATKETAMPKTVCAECKSPSKHLQGCSKPGKRSPVEAATPVRRAARARPSATEAEPQGMTLDEARASLKATPVPELLLIKGAIEAELRERLESVESQLLELRRAVTTGRPLAAAEG